MRNDNLITLKTRNRLRNTSYDTLFGVRLNRAVFGKDADQVARLLAHWLQTHKLTVSGPARRALLSVLCSGPGKDG